MESHPGVLSIQALLEAQQRLQDHVDRGLTHLFVRTGLGTEVPFSEIVASESADSSVITSRPDQIHSIACSQSETRADRIPRAFSRLRRDT
jgi:hypothetical protein